jgi:ribonuclease VapC
MSEAGYLLDASAVLAMVFNEPGTERVEEVVSNARISSANLSEVVAKLYDRRIDTERVELILSNFSVETVAFDRNLAERAGHLRLLTRHLGLSLGDRACLATAQAIGCTVLTADRAWAELDLGIKIETIR